MITKKKLILNLSNIFNPVSQIIMVFYMSEHFGTYSNIIFNLYNFCPETYQYIINNERSFPLLLPNLSAYSKECLWRNMLDILNKSSRDRIKNFYNDFIYGVIHNFMTRQNVAPSTKILLRIPVGDFPEKPMNFNEIYAEVPNFRRKMTFLATRGFMNHNDIRR